MTLAAAVTASLGCGGQPLESSNQSSHVRGTAYRLRAVDGAVLPTRFTPLQDPQPAPAVRIDSGQITFHADGKATGEWHGTGEMTSVSRVFQAAYVEHGSRVLIYTADDAPPDTADVLDNTMSVRAQFYRPSSRERYVVVMTYAR